MIIYLYTLNNIKPQQLQGFFEGWLAPPSPEKLFQILENSDDFVLAKDDLSGMIIGFATAITDGVLAAYIPFLEVLPAYRKQGIGKQLMLLLIEKLQNLYMIDLICDNELLPFYESIGLKPATGAIMRIYQNQSGTPKQV